MPSCPELFENIGRINPTTELSAENIGAHANVVLLDEDVSWLRGSEKELFNAKLPIMGDLHRKMAELA